MLVSKYNLILNSHEEIAKCVMNFDIHVHAAVLLLIIGYKPFCRKTQVLHYTG